MIDRYTRSEMGTIWNPEARFSFMLEVEIAVAQAQSQLGIIPRSAAKSIQQNARFSVKRILELEKITKHDVIAFVSNLAENVGSHGRFIHFGMTSSDVLDTAFSLQVRDATTVLLSSIKNCEKLLKILTKKYADTPCAGRTHGMFAEPTTFGLKMAGFLAELQRHQKRIQEASQQLQVVKLSGAVGTYSGQPPEVEEKVSKILKLKIEPAATQVVPRDRHAHLISALAQWGGWLERLAIEFRHLQRSEVNEVSEGFSVGQKGSSAMPHKKNPISAENLTGISRLLRSYAMASFENMALWHERDISHSSVERVIFPDAFILSDYAAYRMYELLSGLEINKKQMKKNMDLSQGQLFSSHILLALVEKGMPREEAYSHVQRLCHSLVNGEHLRKKILADSNLKVHFKNKEVDSIFKGARHTKNIKKIIKRVLND